MPGDAERAWPSCPVWPDPADAEDSELLKSAELGRALTGRAARPLVLSGDMGPLLRRQPFSDRRARGRVEHRRRCAHGPAARAVPRGPGRSARADAHGPDARPCSSRRRSARGCGPGERAGGARGALVRAALCYGAGGPARDRARWRRAGLAHAAGRDAEGGGRARHDGVGGRPCICLRPGAGRQEGVGRATCGDGAVCGGVGRGACDAGRPGRRTRRLPRSRQRGPMRLGPSFGPGDVASFSPALSRAAEKNGRSLVVRLVPDAGEPPAGAAGLTGLSAGVARDAGGVARATAWWARPYGRLRPMAFVPSGAAATGRLRIRRPWSRSLTHLRCGSAVAAYGHCGVARGIWRVEPQTQPPPEGEGRHSAALAILIAGKWECGLSGPNGRAATARRTASR
jgi:hypothetical protein